MDKNASPLDMPEGSYTYALNAVNQTFKGDRNFIANEPGNEECPITEGYQIVGTVLMSESRVAVFSTNGESSEIGVLSPSCRYEPIINEPCLNFSGPIEGTYRVREGCVDTIYFTDGINPIRVIELTRTKQYYTNGEFDCSKIELFRPFSNACADASVIDAGGSLEPGSYRFAIRYLDNDGNATEWDSIQSAVSIFEEGSSAENSNGVFSDEADPISGVAPLNKSIRLSLQELDTRFPLFQIAVAPAVSGNGQLTGPKLSPEYSTSLQSVTISGISLWADVPLEELQLRPQRYATAKTIEQIQNRLAIGYPKSKQRSYCSFQRAANDVLVNWRRVQVPMYDASNPAHPKNPKALSNLGYMGNEVYALFIVYVFSDGTESPAFLIPGRAADSNDRQLLEVVQGTAGAGEVSFADVEHLGLSIGDEIEKWKVFNTADSIGRLGYYENSALFPLDEDCDGEPLWGSLAGTPIRHHQMPDRSKVPVVSNGQLNHIALEFTNVQYPSSDIVGHYFLRAARTEDNKRVLSAGYLGNVNSYNAGAGVEYEYIGNFRQSQGGFTPAASKSAYWSPDAYFRSRLQGEYVRLGHFSNFEFRVENFTEPFSVSSGPDTTTTRPVQFNFAVAWSDDNLGFLGGNLALSRIQSVGPSSGADAGGEEFFNSSGSLPVNLLETTSPKPQFGAGGIDVLHYASVCSSRPAYEDIYSLTLKRISSCLHSEGETSQVMGGDVFIANLPLPDIYDFVPTQLIDGENEDTIIQGELIASLFAEAEVNSSLAVSLQRGCNTKYQPSSVQGNNARQYLLRYFAESPEEQDNFLQAPLYAGYCEYIFRENPDYSISSLPIRQRALLPSTYDCCSGCLDEHPNRVAFSTQSFAEEQVDNYRVFLPLNYADIEAERGEIVAMQRYNQALYIFTTEAVWRVPENIQERASTDGIVSYLGTGSLFAIPPRLMLDTSTGEAGCIDRFSVIKTNRGLMWADRKEQAIYLAAQGIQNVSAPISSFLEEHFGAYLRSSLGEYGFELQDSSLLTEGVQSAYDNRFNRVIWAYRDYEPLNFAGPLKPEPGSLYYDQGKFYIWDGSYQEIELGDPEHFCDKSFTLSYSLDTGQWASFHSYLPHWMFASKEGLYSFKEGLWIHNVKGKFNHFYGRPYKFVVDWPFPSPLEDLATEHLEIVAKAMRGEAYERWGFFDKVRLYNSHQSTGLLDIRTRNQDIGKNLLLERVSNRASAVSADKVGESWFLNVFRSTVRQASNALVSYSCPDFAHTDVEFLDGALNPSKAWLDRPPIESRYVSCRFELNSTEIQLLLYYVLQKTSRNET